MNDATFAAERAKSLQKLKDVKLAYLRLFSSEDGKKVLKDLEGVCFVNRTTYSPDPGMTEVREGARSVWLYINKMMAVDNPTEQAQTKDNLTGGPK